MSKTTAPIVSVTATIATLQSRGRAFTNARNAVIAHALLTGTKGSVISTESGVDKGDVSRINKIVKGLNKRTNEYKALFSLDVSKLNVDNFESLSAAIALGEGFKRDRTGAAGGAAAGKGQGAAATPSTVNAATGEGEDTDMLATIHEFLVNAPDFGAAKALVNAAIESAERELAEAAAAADAA